MALSFVFPCLPENRNLRSGKTGSGEYRVREVRCHGYPMSKAAGYVLNLWRRVCEYQ